jgi:hypothetical protein
MNWQITNVVGECKKINDTFKKIINLLLSASIMGILTYGCSHRAYIRLKISHEPFYNIIENKREGNILVIQFVDKRPNKYIAAFLYKTVGVKADIFYVTEEGVKLEALLTSYFVETLKEVGYNVVFKEQLSGDILSQNKYDAIILGQIEEFWFDFPNITDTASEFYGRIRIKIKALDPNGQNVLWEKDFTKEKHGIIPYHPLNKNSVKEIEKEFRIALTDLLNQALRDFASEEFYKAIKKSKK